MTTLYSALAALPLVEPPPGAIRGFGELVLLIVGVGKWPMLAVALGASLVAYNYREGAADGNSNVQAAAIAVASGAGTRFLLSLLFD